MKIYCPHCKRYQFTATKSVILEEMPCKCGAKNNFKILFASDATDGELNYKFKVQATKKEK